MPLPNAKPDPAGSNVYRQLNSITLGDLSNEQFDKVYQNVFLNDMSEDELRRLALVGAARQSFSPSTSGPIPNSIVLIDKDFTTTAYQDYFEPEPGTVYQIIGVSVGSTTGLSGSGAIEVDITMNESPFTRLVLIDQSFTSSSDFPVTEIQPSMAFVDENHKVRIRAEGTFTSVNNVVLGVIRVR